MGPFDDDDTGAAVQEDGDSRFFRMARRMVELPILECNRADSRSPHWPRMGMALDVGDDLVDPGADELLVDP